MNDEKKITEIVKKAKYSVREDLIPVDLNVMKSVVKKLKEIMDEGDFIYDEILNEVSIDNVIMNDSNKYTRFISDKFGHVWVGLSDSVAMSVYENADEHAKTNWFLEGWVRIKYPRFNPNHLTFFSKIVVHNTMLSVKKLLALLSVIEPPYSKDTVFRSLTFFVNTMEYFDPVIIKINEYLFLIGPMVPLLSKYELDHSTQFKSILASFFDIPEKSCDALVKIIKNHKYRISKVTSMNGNVRYDLLLYETYTKKYNLPITRLKYNGVGKHVRWLINLISNDLISIKQSLDTVSPKLLRDFFRINNDYSYEEIVNSVPYRDYFKILREDYIEKHLSNEINIREKLWINLMMRDVRYLYSPELNRADEMFEITKNDMLTSRMVGTLIKFIEQDELNFNAARVTSKTIRELLKKFGRSCLSQVYDIDTRQTRIIGIDSGIIIGKHFSIVLTHSMNDIISKFIRQAHVSKSSEISLYDVVKMRKSAIKNKKKKAELAPSERYFNLDMMRIVINVFSDLIKKEIIHNIKTTRVVINKELGTLIMSDNMSFIVPENVNGIGSIEMSSKFNEFVNEFLYE